MEWVVLSAVVALVIGFAAGSRAFRRRVVPPAEPAVTPVTTVDIPTLYQASEAIDAGLLVVDGDHHILHLNRAASGIFEVDHADATGRTVIMVARDHQVDALVDDVLRDGEARDVVIQPPLEGRTLRVRAAAIDLAGRSVAVLIIRDITQLNALERARRDLVANVSHELRTPLASVKLLVETLQSGPPPRVAERMLGQMAHEVDAITQLVDELHELSQIESGRVALQLGPASLRATAHRALERIRPQAERKHIRCTLAIADDLPPALIDDGRIGQVLLNLLHNAVKFTTDGGMIQVGAVIITIDGRARTTDAAVALPAGHQPGTWALVTVHDDGIGIPERDVSRIFERFYKVDRARTRNSGGTGLGLAIAKHLVEGHGGRIWVTSREGAGSTFHFTVPLA
ncbi:MAG: PAS domain-containing protein [Chloroflexi bacterium]|nr:PAS domain-containing protein [Chloroflexota bacterium]